MRPIRPRSRIPTKLRRRQVIRTTSPTTSHTVKRSVIANPTQTRRINTHVRRHRRTINNQTPLLNTRRRPGARRRGSRDRKDTGDRLRIACCPNCSNTAVRPRRHLTYPNGRRRNQQEGDSEVDGRIASNSHVKMLPDGGLTLRRQPSCDMSM